MEPKKVGRTLGIGVRVASNMLRQRVEQAAAAHPGPVEAGSGRTAPPSRPAPMRPSLSSQAATAKRGAKAFGQAILGPFTHAGRCCGWRSLACFSPFSGSFLCKVSIGFAPRGDKARNTPTCCSMSSWPPSLSGFRSVRSPAPTARASGARDSNSNHELQKDGLPGRGSGRLRP
jgi:hypothetical protein